MKGCKVKFFRDSIKQRVVFSVKWHNVNGSIEIDNGGYAMDEKALFALTAAMEEFSRQYADYPENADGFEIAEIDEANDKLMYAVNKLAAAAAKTAQ